MELRLMPSDWLRSQRYGSKPSALSSMVTRLTWLLSMACSDMPVALQSKLASLTRSLMASRTFLSRLPVLRRASNIFTAGGCSTAARESKPTSAAASTVSPPRLQRWQEARGVGGRGRPRTLGRAGVRRRRRRGNERRRRKRERKIEIKIFCAPKKFRAKKSSRQNWSMTSSAAEQRRRCAARSAGCQPRHPPFPPPAGRTGRRRHVDQGLG